MFDKRCAVCGDMVGNYGDGKWLHVVNQYPASPHEVVLADHVERCGAGQGGMFCICDALSDERDAALTAAREAVAGLPWDNSGCVDPVDALAAIDALKEES